MAFLIDPQELKPGLILFRRADVQHRNWYCRIKVPGSDRYKTVSLRTADVTSAREAAFDADADPEQLQAIEAGAPFRRLVERHGAMEITEVRRQRDDWQRTATRELATGRTQAAIERYDAAGAIHGHDTREDARRALVTDWMADREGQPAASQMLLAYTRADVAELNRLARETLRTAGKLGPDQTVDTANGERAFAVGDRVMFLRNERSMGVKNGTLGTLTALDRSSIVVRLDDGRNLRFDRKEYADLTHGYAATIHKIQGATVDRVYVLASRYMDRHATYVAMSRHRHAVKLRYGRDEFARRELALDLGAPRPTNPPNNTLPRGSPFGILPETSKDKRRQR
ncbi:AAA family ATPase [Brevundimonas bullata]|uniref:AAA family ATPase n=1 Tax=Brevundimonas bullata TaxID=13160 RepID=UPI002FDB5003